MSEDIGTSINKGRIKYPIEVARWYKKVTTTYAEADAETVLTYIEILHKMPVLSMRNNYKVDHSGKSKDTEGANTNSNRHEELYCKRTFAKGDCMKYVDKLVDYQVPLATPKNDNKDNYKYREGMGRIDLLALNGDTATILEVKLASSSESPLKALLEVFTYWKILGGGSDPSHFLSHHADIKEARALDKAIVIIKDQNERTGNILGKYVNRQGSVKELFQTLGVKCYLAEPVKGEDHIFTISKELE